MSRRCVGCCGIFSLFTGGGDFEWWWLLAVSWVVVRGGGGGGGGGADSITVVRVWSVVGSWGFNDIVE